MIVNSQFTALLTIHFLSFLSNAYFKNAVIFLILLNLAQEDAELTSSLISAVFMIPNLAISGLGGQLADAVDRAILSRYLKAFELCGAALAAYGIWLNSFSLVLAGFMIMQTASAAFSSVRSSLIPDLAGTENTPIANSWVETASIASMAIGTTMIGLTMANADRPAYHLILLILCLTSISALGTLLLPRDTPLTRTGQVSFRIIGSIVRCLTVTLKDGRIRTMSLTLAWALLMMSLVLSTAPALMIKAEATPDVIGYALTAYAIVGAIAGLATGRAFRHFAPLQMTSLGLMVMGLTLAAIGAGGVYRFDHSTLYPLICLVVLFSVGFSLVLIPLNTQIQLEAGADERGSTIAGSNTLNAISMVGGGMLISCVQIVFSLEQLYSFAGLITTMIAITSIRHMRSNSSVHK